MEKEIKEIVEIEGMEVEDVIDNIETADVTGSGNGLKTVAKIGLAAGLIYLGYRYAFKPLKAKFKNKKNQTIKAEAVEVTDAYADECGENSEENVVKFDGKRK